MISNKAKRLIKRVKTLEQMPTKPTSEDTFFKDTKPNELTIEKRGEMASVSSNHKTNIDCPPSKNKTEVEHPKHEELSSKPNSCYSAGRENSPSTTKTIHISGPASRKTSNVYEYTTNISPLVEGLKIQIDVLFHEKDGKSKKGKTRSSFSALSLSKKSDVNFVKSPTSIDTKVENRGDKHDNNPRTSSLNQNSFLITASNRYKLLRRTRSCFLYPVSHNLKTQSKRKLNRYKTIDLPSPPPPPPKSLDHDSTANLIDASLNEIPPEIISPTSLTRDKEKDHVGLSKSIIPSNADEIKVDKIGENSSKGDSQNAFVSTHGDQLADNNTFSPSEYRALEKLNLSNTDSKPKNPKQGGRLALDYELDKIIETRAQTGYFNYSTLHGVEDEEFQNDNIGENDTTALGHSAKKLVQRSQSHAGVIKKNVLTAECWKTWPKLNLPPSVFQPNLVATDESNAGLAISRSVTNRNGIDKDISTGLTDTQNLQSEQIFARQKDAKLTNITHHLYEDRSIDFLHQTKRDNQRSKSLQSPPSTIHYTKDLHRPRNFSLDSGASRLAVAPPRPTTAIEHYEYTFHSGEENSEYPSSLTTNGNHHSSAPEASVCCPPGSASSSSMANEELGLFTRPVLPPISSRCCGNEDCPKGLPN